MAGTRWIDLATGIRVPVLEQGDSRGPAVLLLHAYSHSGVFWKPLLERLPPEVHALAPTARGHGGADKPETGYGQNDYAADALAVLDGLGIERAVLVGQSSGGYVARAVAERAPRRVGGLVLLGSPYSLQGRRAPFADRVEAMSDPVSDEDIREIEQPWHRHWDVPAELVEELFEEKRRIPARVWQLTLSGIALAPMPITPLRRIPALVVHGADDRFLTLAEQRRLAEELRCAEVTVYPDTGHTVLWERPQRVADDLLAFLVRIGALPGGVRDGRVTGPA